MTVRDSLQWFASGALLNDFVLFVEISGKNYSGFDNVKDYRVRILVAIGFSVTFLGLELGFGVFGGQWLK